MTDLLAIGGAHIDQTARLIAPHIAGASNPCRFTSVVGGGAFNGARIAKLRGVQRVAMMAVRGGDAAGAEVEAALEKSGIVDFSGTFIDRATPSYTAIMDVDGELVTALADMDLYEKGFERQLRRLEGRGHIREAKALLIDANLPQGAINRVAQEANAPIFAIAISPAKVVRLRAIAPRIDIVFMNRRELYALTGEDDISNAAPALATLGFSRAVISDGSSSILVFEDSKISQINVPVLEAIVDVTGAGDALAGGTIAALLKAPSRPLLKSVLEGAACARLALQVAGPLCESHDMDKFSASLEAMTAAQR